MQSFLLLSAFFRREMQKNQTLKSTSFAMSLPMVAGRQKFNIEHWEYVLGNILIKKGSLVKLESENLEKVVFTPPVQKLLSPSQRIFQKFFQRTLHLDKCQEKSKSLSIKFLPIQKLFKKLRYCLGTGNVISL